MTREDEYFFFDVIIERMVLIDGRWAAFTNYNTIWLAANDAR